MKSKAAFQKSTRIGRQNPFTSPRGWESGLSVMARAAPRATPHRRRQSRPDRCDVSHKATIPAGLCSLWHRCARLSRSLDQSPACLNVLDFKDPVRVRLVVYNDTSHYAARTGKVTVSAIQVVQ